MRHFAFVTTELFPYTSGGAGVLIASLVTKLRGRGDKISVILCADVDVDIQDTRVVAAPPITAPGWDFGFMDVSMGAAEALAEVHENDPVDAVEFQDFDGLGFWALTHRRDLGLGDIPISVRVHGPVDLQIEAMGESSFDLDVVACMEREVFNMADEVVAPSEGIAALVTARYDIDPNRVVIGPPTVRLLSHTTRWEPGGSSMLVVGRLSEVKGSHDMVRASIPVLRQHPHLELIFVGADGWSISTDQPMTEFIRTLVPEDVADRIAFIPHAEPEGLAELVATSMIVIVPSRFETFNLGVHEARALGAPVIVPEIAAFEGDAFEHAGVLTYDRSTEGLTRLLTSIAEDPSIVVESASQPRPPLGDPLAPYSPSTVEVRHERSQGGVATAALARVEAVRFSPAHKQTKHSVLRSIAGMMPTALVDVLKPLVPRSVKGKIKTSVGWDSLVDVRNWENRWATLEAESAAGAWRSTDIPRVSVVIPCYNQGAYLRQAIISVFDQTVGAFEIVVVDDGSDEPATIEVIDTINLDRVRIIRQDNAGLPGARNTGIAAAKGEFVVTLDSDDMLAPPYFEELMGALDSNPDAAYAHCWAELFGDFHMIWATRPPNAFQLLMSNSVVGCVMLRKAAWDEVGGYDESMLAGNEDWDLWIRLLHRGHIGVQVREPLFRYRKHGVSMSVETEGAYERALSELPTRLPEIYNRQYLRTRKLAEYPLISVLSPLPVSAFRHAVSDDMQHIRMDSSGIPAVSDDIRGKYVAWWPEGAKSGDAVLTDLCLMLEDQPDVGAAATSGGSPIVVVRTWSLLDVDGPSATIETDLVGAADNRLAPGQFPDKKWHVPEQIEGVPVQRQRPEEVGVLPDWIPS